MSRADRLLILAVAGLTLDAAAAQPQVRPAGMVARPSPDVDALYVVPGIDLRAYTAVLIEPPTVRFAADWLNAYNRSPNLARPLTQAEASRIAASASVGFQGALEAAHQSEGFKLARTPGPGVYVCARR